MSESRTHYEVLQIKTDAHPTIVRYAFRFLAAYYHPDNSESGDAEHYKLITEAFNVLIDDAKRAEYDRSIGLRDDN